MRLQKRLTLAAAIVISTVAITIGLIAVLSSYTTQLNQLESRLNANASAVKSAKTDPVSTALLLSGQKDIPVAVAYVDADGQLSVLQDNEIAIPENLNTEALKSASDGVTRLAQNHSILLKSVPLDDEDYVVFAVDAKPIESQRNSQLRMLIVVICLAVGIAIVAVNRLIRRDIRQLENLASRATLIAAGDLSVRLPERQGHSEVDELTEAVGSMLAHLTRLIEQEQATHRAMQNFLSDASHELRTPLTVIRGYTEILQGLPESQSEQEQRAYERMSAEIERMNQLVDDLLLLAELGEQQTISFEAIDVSQLLVDAVDDLQSLNLERNIERQIEAPVMIRGSVRLIGQLFANLIGNINRHTPANAQVRVKLSQSVDVVTIQFDDAGPGLPDEAYANQAHHFQRFDKARSRKSGGFGLGMSIMRAVVNQHGGTFVLSPSDLGGLKTTITLPVNQPTTAAL